MDNQKVRSLASRLDSLPLSRWHGYLMAICCLGLLFDAYDVTIISIVLPLLSPLWKITPVQIGILMSGSFIGMLAGAILFGVLADIIGRWKVFQITLLVYALLTGACALAGGFTSLFILRIIVGLGLGGLVPVDLAYLVEYVPSRYRGRFLGWFNGFYPLGNAAAFFVGFFVVAVPAGWRWGFLLGMIPALFVVVIRRGLPESVRYLAQKGRIPEAVEVVEGLERRVLKKVTVPRDEAIENEKNITAAGPEAKVGVLDLFRGGLARSTISMFVFCFCANYVIFCVGMWFPILLKNELGYSLSKGFLFLAFGNLIGMIGQLTAGINADYLGRRLNVLSIRSFYWESSPTSCSGWARTRTWA